MSTPRRTAQAPEPTALTAGDPVTTPDGPGTFLGLATYEVRRIGMHAGQRTYVWTNPLKGSVVVDGPYVCRLEKGFPQGPIRGYSFDELLRAARETAAADALRQFNSEDR